MSARRGGRRWREMREAILARDDYVCRLHIPDVCVRIATTVDHIIPIVRWPEGELVEANLIAACQPCNRRKSAKLDGWQGRAPDEIDPYSL